MLSPGFSFPGPFEGFWHINNPPCLVSNLNHFWGVNGQVLLGGIHCRYCTFVHMIFSHGIRKSFDLELHRRVFCNHFQKQITVCNRKKTLETFGGNGISVQPGSLISGSGMTSLIHEPKPAFVCSESYIRHPITIYVLQQKFLSGSPVASPARGPIHNPFIEQEEGHAILGRYLCHCVGPRPQNHSP